VYAFGVTLVRTHQGAKTLPRNSRQAEPPQDTPVTPGDVAVIGLIAVGLLAALYFGGVFLRDHYSPQHVTPPTLTIERDQ